MEDAVADIDAKIAMIMATGVTTNVEEASLALKDCGGDVDRAMALLDRKVSAKPSRKSHPSKETDNGEDDIGEPSRRSRRRSKKRHSRKGKYQIRLFKLGQRNTSTFTYHILFSKEKNYGMIEL